MKLYTLILLLLLSVAANSVAVADSYCVHDMQSGHVMEEGVSHQNMHDTHQLSDQDGCSSCGAEHSGCGNHGCATHCSVYLTSLYTFPATEFKESPASLILHKPFPDVYARLLRPPRHV